MIISCLSQKGGVGKSTLSRLIATACAKGGWTVLICDFNTKQQTSMDWSDMRQAAGFEPAVPAKTFASMKQALEVQSDYHLLVIDGRPDSDTSSLDIARHSDLIIVPVGCSVDDLKPQVLFAHELQSKGIDKGRMLFVVNRSVDSQVAVDDARDYVVSAGYACAAIDLPMKTGYQMAQNIGRAIFETNFPGLNSRAAQLAEELVIAAQEVREAA